MTLLKILLYGQYGKLFLFCLEITGKAVDISVWLTNGFFIEETCWCLARHDLGSLGTGKLMVLKNSCYVMELGMTGTVTAALYGITGVMAVMAVV